MTRRVGVWPVSRWHRRAREATNPARRYGTAAEFGATAAFLCSAHAGFIVGQNFLADGGAMNATV